MNELYIFVDGCDYICGYLVRVSVVRFCAPTVTTFYYHANCVRACVRVYIVTDVADVPVI